MTSHQIPTQQPGVGTQKSHAQNKGKTDTELYTEAMAAGEAGHHNLTHSKVWRYIRKFRDFQGMTSQSGVTDPFLVGLLSYADTTGNTATRNAAQDAEDPRIILGLPANAGRAQIEDAYTKKLRYIATVSRDERNLRRVHSAYQQMLGGLKR